MGAGSSPPVVEIDLAKERMKFSAGHFTIFSATERENFHGHNYTVGVTFTARVDDNGMVCDYGVLKDACTVVCESLDEIFLLPTQSRFLQVGEQDGQVVARFAGETLRFLPRDVKLLPVPNITVESLAGWILAELRRSFAGEAGAALLGISVRVASGPGQGATVRWEA